MGKPFRILSIDGGGIRGVYPAHVLRCIEERLQINLFDTFDMIAGTSTGSIIAAGVATGVPVAEIVEMYKEHGAKIFRKSGLFCPGKAFSPCSTVSTMPNVWKMCLQRCFRTSGWVT